MKRVVVTGESQCGLEDFDDPGVAENYAKIKIHSAPLCTEFHVFLRGMKRPLGGHEAAGEVVEIGPAVTMVRPGARVVVLPQSIKFMLPPMAGEAVHIVKSSAIVSVIAVVELTTTGRNIIADTYLSFEVWFTVAAVYLAITLTLSIFVTFLEKRYAVKI